MSKLDKRAISILVIATFMMSMIPLALAVPFAITTVTPPGDIEYGDVLTVTGEGVSSGAEVKIFWDYASGTLAHLLNTTEGNPDGSFDCDVTVPSDKVGSHYLWAKDVATGETVSSVPLNMIPRIKLSPSSGLPGDEVDVKGYGFIDDAKVEIIMEEFDPKPSTEVIGTGATGKMTFSGKLTNLPVDPGTITITGAALPITDTPGAPPAGTLSSADASGTINYVTGDWNLIFTANEPADGVQITADYNWLGYEIQVLDTLKTDELGSFTKEFNVPSVLYGNYTITANGTLDHFIVGASISVTPVEGPTGTVVTVDGRGWTKDKIMSFVLGTETVAVVNDDTVTVDVRGEFSADVVIPGGVTEGEGSITASESDTGAFSSIDFDVTGLPEVEVSPTYGSPGATITVTGSNFTQIAGTEVVIELWDKDLTPEWIADLVIAETDSDGTFEDTFTSPAVAFIGYDVRAYDLEYFGIVYYAEDAFKVGLIAMIINPTHGSAGTEVSLTGIGFLEDSTYNLTFGDIVYEEYGAGVSSGEAISDIFYVPNVELGTYDVTVVDEDENELTAHFTVTAVTEVELDPAKAPNDYNMTIEGYNFADYVYLVDFVLYNATDEWEMDVDYEGSPVKTGTDGNFTGYWKVLPEAELSLGDYTINVTGYDDFLVQVPFSVVEARVDVAPRKALFDRGDTIQFNVKNDFDFEESYMKLWDPYDNLYWKTELFEDWLKVEDVYTVPYYLQTSGMNPMTLSQDAPLGTWFYIFYEEGTTQLTNGTFVVGPSAAAQVEEKLTEIWVSMEGITEDIDSITSEIEDEISTLSGEMDDVVSDVQGMIDDITSDLAGELAGVAADTEAAVGELEGVIGDIATAQNALQSELDDMSEDTAAARQAAEDAQGAAQGLTTIVYGAIACSLIAALAAVVSLMQISKKIA